MPSWAFVHCIAFVVMKSFVLLQNARDVCLDTHALHEVICQKKVVI